MNKKPVFMALAGLPSSGKSTYAKQYEKENVVKVFASDEYREKICGNRKDQTKNDKVFKALYADLCEALKNGEDCILDATNTTVKMRQKVLNAIKDIDCVKIASIISTDVETCVKRNENRPEENKVPNEVIYKFARSFECPMLWEGWDRIYFQGYDTDFCPRFNERCHELIMKQQKSYCQKTPHHKFTLGGHSNAVAEILKDDSVLRSAAYYHDIAKCLAEWNWTEKPEEGVRHYYNHDHISQHYMLQNLEAFECKTWDEVFEVLWIIGYHMEFRTWEKSEKVMKKWTDRVGQKWMDDLARFVRADEAGSGTADYAYHVAITEKVKAGYYVEHPEELIPEDYVEPEPAPEPEPVEEQPEEIHTEEPADVQEMHTENGVDVQETSAEDSKVAESQPFDPAAMAGAMGAFGGLGGLFGAMMGGFGGIVPPVGQEVHEEVEETQETMENAAEEPALEEDKKEDDKELKIKKIYEV